MKLQELKNDIKGRLVTALTAAPALSVVLISAVYQLMLGSPYLIYYGNPLIMGYMTFVAIAGSLALSLIYRRTFTPVLMSVLFALCFTSNLIFILNGTTDVLADGFFEMILLIFYLPSWSYMSVAASISFDFSLPLLIITAILSLICLVVGIAVFVLNKKEKRKE